MRPRIWIEICALESATVSPAQTGQRNSLAMARTWSSSGSAATAAGRGIIMIRSDKRARATAPPRPPILGGAGLGQRGGFLIGRGVGKPDHLDAPATQAPPRIGGRGGATLVAIGHRAAARRCLGPDRAWHGARPEGEGGADQDDQPAD